jgi:formylglycine-generating enzyme required for sulfatase activity
MLPEPLASLGLTVHIVGKVRCLVPPLCEVPAGEVLSSTVAAFQIGKYPVTVAEYEAFMVSPDVRFEFELRGHWDRGGQRKKPDHPVVYVSWRSAALYAAWLTKMTGRSWRLPTESEWAHTARGTDERIYPWGNTFDTTRCNTDGGKRGTTRVGDYPNGASPYGALDMAGNVWEWTSGEADGPPGAKGKWRVLRGGSWFDSPEFARTDARLIGDPTLTAPDRGFRLVCDSPIA